MKNQKGLAPILIVLLIAVAVGGILIYQRQTKPIPVSQPSPSPVSSPADTANPNSIGANWKTYTSVKRKFTVMYPSNWLPSEVDPDGLYLTSPQRAKDNQQFHMIIGVFETTKQSLEDYVKTTFTTEKSISSALTVNGVQFYQITDPNNKYPFLIAKVGNKIVAVQSEDGFPDGGAYYYDDKDPILMNNIQIFNQILSTFKFTP